MAQKIDLGEVTRRYSPISTKLALKPFVSLRRTRHLQTIEQTGLKRVVGRQVVWWVNEDAQRVSSSAVGGALVATPFVSELQGGSNLSPPTVLRAAYLEIGFYLREVGRQSDLDGSR